ncbi:importin subunit alpha-4 [Anaeramoeba ignava]|uniref:Importin subunit alpha n=1 Tax=Anaeramoeba ignava TaxID=1746090 RepID=A0A9Q0RAD5_ANAIG|nr:importin subunit alpha-4 [Anaeramoeba ignava]|eukprot:Anaeramoba_ignava/a90937_16.p1 GENE.a90937_16~~a90937_16.p1  ORF type:complete len:525 (-),score=163.69 a90937_16:30-1604(-)
MSFLARISNRRSSFKKRIDPTESRRKRYETSINIGRKKKEEQLMKKRNIAITSPDNTIDNYDLYIKQRLKELPDFVIGLSSTSKSDKRYSLSQIRKLVSVEKNPPITEVVETGALSLIVPFLRDFKHPKLQFESAWIITNIIADGSKHAKMVVKQNSIPLLVDLLKSQNEEVVEQAIWAIGNLAADRAKYRDILLKQNTLNILIDVLTNTKNSGIFQNVTWTITNFFRGRPPPQFSEIQNAIPYLIQLLSNNDKEVISDACWGISYLVHRLFKYLSQDFFSQVNPKLISLFSSDQPKIIIPAIKAVGYIFVGSIDQSHALIQLNLLHILSNLLLVPKSQIQKEICWFLSYTAEFAPNQMLAILKSTEIIPRLLSLMNSSDFQMRQEAAWVLSNIITYGNVENIDFLVQNGAIKSLCNLLEINDTDIIILVLDALLAVLEAGEKFGNDINRYATIIEESDGLNHINNLFTHNNEDIYLKSLEIIQRFFTNEDSEDDSIMPDIIENDNQPRFSFGTPDSEPRKFQV